MRRRTESFDADLRSDDSEMAVSGLDNSRDSNTASHKPHPAPRQTLSIHVRGCRLPDLPDLRSVASIELLNQPESLLKPFSPFWTGLRATLRWPRSRRRVLVARADDRVVGFAVFQPLRPDLRWRLDALGTATGVYDADPVVEAVIEHGIMLAGLNGVKRLYARLPEGSRSIPALRNVGFSPFAQETILVSTTPTPRRTSVRVRPQEPSDTWAVHQLYIAAVPRQVQYAEAFTSHHWDLGKARTSEPFDVRGWVVDEGTIIVGHARTTSRGGDHVLELIYLPDRLDVLEGLLDGVLSELFRLTVRRVFCVIRTYQEEARTALLDRDFAPLHDQGLYVKYTTANLRVPIAETAAVPSERGERVPTRVPTFLQGQAADEQV